MSYETKACFPLKKPVAGREITIPVHTTHAHYTHAHTYLKQHTHRVES